MSVPDKVPFANRKFIFFPNKFEWGISQALGETLDHFKIPEVTLMEDDEENEDIKEERQEVTAQYWDKNLTDDQNNFVLLAKRWKRQGERLSPNEWETFRGLWGRLEQGNQLLFQETLPRKIAVSRIIQETTQCRNKIFVVTTRVSEELLFRYLQMDLGILREPAIIAHIEKQKIKRNTRFLKELRKIFSPGAGRKDPPAPKWQMDWVLVQSLLIKTSPFANIAKELQKNPIPGIKKWKENTLRKYAVEQKKKYLDRGLKETDLIRIAKASCNESA